jgi:hypothetical protein
MNEQNQSDHLTYRYLKGQISFEEYQTLRENDQLMRDQEFLSTGLTTVEIGNNP